MEYTNKVNSHRLQVVAELTIDRLQPILSFSKVFSVVFYAKYHSYTLFAQLFHFLNNKKIKMTEIQVYK